MEVAPYCPTHLSMYVRFLIKERHRIALLNADLSMQINILDCQIQGQDNVEASFQWIPWVADDGKANAE